MQPLAIIRPVYKHARISLAIVRLRFKYQKHHHYTLNFLLIEPQITAFACPLLLLSVYTELKATWLPGGTRPVLKRGGGETGGTAILVSLTQLPAFL